MSKEKLALFTEFADRIKHTERNKLMEAFMPINLEARQKGIQFNDKETALPVTTLSPGMPSTEKKKLDMLKMLLKEMAGSRWSGAPCLRKYQMIQLNDSDPVSESCVHHFS